MSIEEVIRKLEKMAADREDILPGCLGWDEAEPLREAVTLLKTHPEAQPNTPLTPEELREMDGQLMWVFESELGISYWAIINKVTDSGVFFRTALDARDYGAFSVYGRAWLAYRRPPKEDSHE